MQNDLAPIVIFCYNRLDVLQRLVTSLKKCRLAQQSDLIIFSDGPKSEIDSVLVNEVRLFLKEIKGFKSKEFHFADVNKGLANSIISGVTEVLNRQEKIIVLEDDLTVSSNFLEFMNQALNYYSEDKKVFSISGFSLPIKISESYALDGYFIPRAFSWGWASWKDRWKDVDWEIKEFHNFKNNRKEIEMFNVGGSDLFSMLSKQQAGKIDSWAIRWGYNQFKKNGLTLFPAVSKVQNYGFINRASNTNVYNRFFTKLDNGLKSEFIFDKNLEVKQYFLSEFQNYFSIKTRIKSKFLTYLFKTGIIKNKS